MIFVALGTHPQPMNRLRQPLEDLATALPELGPFIGQLGTSASPEGWQIHRLMPGDVLRSFVAEADIVITHGGPATIAECRTHGKIPMVIPRRRDKGEHVDDHQLHYCRRLAEAQEIVLVENEQEVVRTAAMYQSLVESMPPPTPHDPTHAIDEVRRISESLMTHHGRSTPGS